MSKSQLQTNNTRLASLIDELKGKATGSGSAGSGGSGNTNIETCTVTVDASMALPGEDSGNVYYTANDMTFVSTNWSHNSTFTVAKNTIIYFNNFMMMDKSNSALIGYAMANAMFKVTTNLTVKITT